MKSYTMPFVTTLLTAQVQWGGLVCGGFLVTTRRGSQLCSSGFICIYRMCLFRSNSIQSRHTVFSIFQPNFSVRKKMLESEGFCNFLSRLTEVQNQSVPCSHRWRAGLKPRLSSKPLWILWSWWHPTRWRWAIHFPLFRSIKRSGHISLSLQMGLPTSRLFHQVNREHVQNTLSKWGKKRKKGKHIFLTCRGAAPLHL